MATSHGTASGACPEPRRPSPCTAVALRALALVSAATLAACNGDNGANLLPVEDGRRVAAIHVEPGTLGLAAPEDADTLRAWALDQDGDTIHGAAFAWASSDPAVVQVDAAGLVTAMALGRAQVSATAGGVSGSVEVEVDPAHAVARNCAPCHTALSGDHAALLFSVGTCWACHGMDGGAHTAPTRNHTGASGGIELLGVHDTLTCAGCHSAQGPKASPASFDDCVACHEETFLSQHGAVGFPTSCVACHVPTTWTEQATDHGLWSGGFELKWMHGSLACDACHVPETFSLRFSPTEEEDCYACHQDAYQAQHGDRAYPTTCLTCHDTATWLHAVFDHVERSGGFVLAGVHSDLVCTSCHDPETFAPTWAPSSSGDCVTCHESDYDAQHAGSGFSTTCTSCHTPTAWSDVTFDHHAASGGFDLVGVHGTLACSSCHAPGTFDPLFSPSGEGDCIACHESDYDAQHAGSGFPVTCTSCHAPTAWSDVTFDHDAASGGFDLVGVHGTLACSNCHAPGTFDPLFSPSGEGDCIACHQGDYDDQHAGSDYPTSCLTCHTANTWTGALFDHDAQYFPIFSGKHQGRWQSTGCPTCHTDPGDYGDFTCFNCHRHDQSRADSDHDEVAGYVYDPVRCVACHPAGTA